MHCDRIMRHCAVAAVVALAGTVAVAEDWDDLGQAGQYSEATTGTVVRGTGGSFDAVTIYCPWIIDPLPLVNAAGVETVAGNPVGVVSTGGSASNLNVVAILGTTDTAGGGFSNNVIIEDGFNTLSNPVGTLLPDGTLVWREAFGTGQNNLGYETGITGITPQLAFPEPDAASNKVFGAAFAGIDGNAGAVFTGTPAAAIAPITGDVLSAMTGFSFSVPADILTGVGVWANADNDPNLTTDEWLTGGVTLDSEPSGNLRTTQPVMAVIDFSGTEASWLAWGLGVSGGLNLGGGSAEPKALFIDRVGDNDGYTDAAYILAQGGGGVIAAPGTGINLGALDPTKAFLDHSATGGGGGPFVNSLFDINSSGQIACVWEDTSVSPRLTEIRRYDPIIVADRIAGYSPPITILSAGSDGTVQEVLSSDGLGTIFFFTPVSGCAIDEHGNVAFVAVTDVDIDLTDPLNPVLVSSTNTLFYWTDNGYLGATDEALHAIVAGGQNGVTLTALNAGAGGADLEVGFFPIEPQSNGDTFSREGLSEDGRYLAVNARGASAAGTNNPLLDGGVLLTTVGGETSVDHTLIIDLGAFTVAPGCDGDANGDLVVDVNDISFVLFRLGQNNGPCGDGDANGDGVNDVNDISYVLFRLGTCNPGGPC